MQQELADLKKRSADEVEALKQENSQLRRKIEADPTQKGKVKEASEATKSSAYQPSEEESDYNPTPHTFTTTQQTLIIPTHHTHFHPTLPRPRCHPSPPSSTILFHLTCYHPNHQAPPPFYRFHRQYLFPCLVGTFHVGPLYRRNRSRRAPQSVHNTRRPLYIPWCRFLQSLPNHP